MYGNLREYGSANMMLQRGAIVGGRRATPRQSMGLYSAVPPMHAGECPLRGVPNRNQPDSTGCVVGRLLCFHRFGIELGIFGFEGGQLRQRALFVGLGPDA